MKEFKKIWKIWSFIALFLSIITLIYFRIQEPPCSEYYEKAKFDEFNGIIENIFIDKKQHNYKTILLQNKDSLIKLVVDADKSGFYDYIKKGDSIIKKSGRYEMKVFRNSMIDTTFILDYGCKE